MSEARATAHALGEQQNGVFSRAQLIAQGLPASTIDSRVRSGSWALVARGVYRMSGTRLTTSGVLTAAHLIDPRLAASHLTAARLHRFAELPPRRLDEVVHLSTPSATRTAGPWRVHRSTTLTEDQVISVGGWRCTRRERTLLDLAGLVTAERIERILDAQLVCGAVTVQGLRHLIERSGAGRPGVATLRRLVADRLAVVVESELEARFLRLITTAGLASPVAQHPAPWGSPEGNRRVDFAYPDKRLAIELDGRRWHSDPRSFENDRRRDQQALVHGWRTVRFTWRQLNDHPEEVVAVLQRLLANAA